MKPREEKAPHELYIRSLPVGKTSAPLKFYANVTGKFLVERELGERVESAVRDRTIDAERQRTERKTILLDAPLKTAPVTVKPVKKKTAMPKRPIAVEAHHRTQSTSSSSQPSRMISPRPPVPAREVKPPVKEPIRDAPSSHNHLDDGFEDRLIHFLALQARTFEDTRKMVGGGTIDPETLLRVLRKVITYMTGVMPIF